MNEPVLRSCPNPTCGWDAWERELHDRDASEVDCPRCGRYRMTDIMIRSLGGGIADPDDQRLLQYLSAYTKQTSAAGNVPVIDISNWRDHARTHAETPPATKLEKLLGVFRARSPHLGAIIDVVAVEDAPLTDSANSEELLYLLAELRRRGDIEWPVVVEPGGLARQVEPTKEPLTRGRLTVQGWSLVKTRADVTGGEEVMAKKYDVFICHASEDKADVAQPLAERLQAREYEVWYDRFVLRLGDGLRRKIDEGLVQSRYGVVILSPDFFTKDWPQKELDGLVAREVGGVKVILPIWHRIDKDGVVAHSPTLADRVAARTKDGLDEVVRQVTEELGPPRGRARSTHASAPSAPTPATPITSRPPAPMRTPVAAAPLRAGTAPASSSGPIKIIGVDERGISKPRNDGTQGSALYRVPLKLSRRPSSLWGQAFEQMWNQPFVPGGSLRHRPGIASVVGDTIVLDGTTIEEVQEAHLTTVKNVIAEVNEKVVEFERRERERMDREAEAERARQAELRDRINRMRFE